VLHGGPWPDIVQFSVRILSVMELGMTLSLDKQSSFPIYGMRMFKDRVDIIISQFNEL
jgi:hypothetical protein